MQPAEFAKLGVITGMALLLAERIESKNRDSLRDTDVLGALAIAAVPAVLIMAQPDLGTMLVLAVTVFGSARGRRCAETLALRAGRSRDRYGVRRRSSSGVLKGYQLLRFEAFMNPNLDPRGAGYNTTQAGSRSATAASSGRASSTARRRSRGSCPSSTPTSSSPSRARSSGSSGPRRSSGLFVVLLWRAIGSPPGRTTRSAGWRAPGSSAGSASRRSRTSACASGSCP